MPHDSAGRASWTPPPASRYPFAHGRTGDGRDWWCDAGAASGCFGAARLADLLRGDGHRARRPGADDDRHRAGQREADERPGRVHEGQRWPQPAARGPAGHAGEAGGGDPARQRPAAGAGPAGRAGGPGPARGRHRLPAATSARASPAAGCPGAGPDLRRRVCFVGARPPVRRHQGHAVLDGADGGRDGQANDAPRRPAPAGPGTFDGGRAAVHGHRHELRHAGRHGHRPGPDRAALRVPDCRPDLPDPSPRARPVRLSAGAWGRFAAPDLVAGVVQGDARPVGQRGLGGGERVVVGAVDVGPARVVKSRLDVQRLRTGRQGRGRGEADLQVVGRLGTGRRHRHQGLRHLGTAPHRRWRRVAGGARRHLRVGVEPVANLELRQRGRRGADADDADHLIGPLLVGGVAVLVLHLPAGLAAQRRAQHRRAVRAGAVGVGDAHLAVRAGLQRRAAAAAVDVRLAAVLHHVRAGGRGTDQRRRRTVKRARAAAAGGATHARRAARAAVGPAAVAARLDPVLHLVRARRRRALARGAHAAGAVRPGTAPLAGATAGAGPAAAAVDAGLAPVLHPVAAGRRGAQAGRAHAAGAVGAAGAAHLPDRAQLAGRRRRAGAPAVDVALVAVLDGVAAAGRRAGAVRAAQAVHAVARHRAALAVAALLVRGGRRAGAAAVGARLGAVLHAVAAGGGRAGAAGAHAARAVGPRARPAAAHLSVRAGRARPAAVDVRLGAVLHAVGAVGRGADPLDAAPVRAVTGHRAGLAVRALLVRGGRRAGAAAVGARLGAVLHAVAAGGGRAGAAGAHAARAVGPRARPAAAHLSVRAGRARPAAGDVRLGAVLHAGGAVGRGADPLDADPVRAVTGHRAGLPVRALLVRGRRRARTTAVDRGLGAVLHRVRAGGGRASAAGAHAARAVAARVSPRAAHLPVRARRAGATAVDVRLPAVLHLVVAGGGLAEAGRAHAAGTEGTTATTDQPDDALLVRGRGGARAAAVDVRLGAVGDAVGTGRRRARTGGAAHAAGAITAAPALLPVAALATGGRGGARAAAVDVRLGAVRHHVGARRRRAQLGRRGADLAVAVLRHGASRAGLAGRTGRAAAVDVRLGAVLDAVGAARRLTQAAHAVPALAVGPQHAGLVRRAGRPGRVGAAALDVRLGAVHHHVHTGTNRTGASRADQAGAVAAHLALAGAGTARARPPAVDVGLAAVLHRVGARRRGADAGRAHAAHAVRRQQARLPVLAAGAAGAAAVDVRLGPVQGQVGAARALADPRRAHAAQAVRGHRTGLARHALGGAGAAAVDVRLGAVHDHVGAGPRCAS